MRALLLVPDVFILLVRLALDKDVPGSARAMIGGALAYFVLPFDLLPEAILGGRSATWTTSCWPPPCSRRRSAATSSPTPASTGAARRICGWSSRTSPRPPSRSSARSSTTACAGCCRGAGSSWRTCRSRADLVAALPGSSFRRSPQLLEELPDGRKAAVREVLGVVPELGERAGPPALVDRHLEHELELVAGLDQAGLGGRSLLVLLVEGRARARRAGRGRRPSPRPRPPSWRPRGSSGRRCAAGRRPQLGEVVEEGDLHRARDVDPLDPRPQRPDEQTARARCAR